MSKSDRSEDFSLEEFYYYLDLKEEWKRSLPQYSETEWVKMCMPEVKAIIENKIEYWQTRYDALYPEIKQHLKFIHQSTSDDFTKWFCRHWLQQTKIRELKGFENHVKRLQRLLLIAKGKSLSSRGLLTQTQIEDALALPLSTLIEGNLRKLGDKFVTLCPFHNEKTPSLTIYSRTNSFYCFGCGKGGNSIKFIQELHQCNFRDAVQYLNQK